MGFLASSLGFCRFVHDFPTEIVDNFMDLNVSLFVLQKKLRQIFFGFKLALRASIQQLILLEKRLQ